MQRAFIPWRVEQKAWSWNAGRQRWWRWAGGGGRDEGQGAAVGFDQHGPAERPEAQDLPQQASLAFLQHADDLTSTSLELARQALQVP